MWHYMTTLRKDEHMDIYFVAISVVRQMLQNELNLRAL